MRSLEVDGVRLQSFLARAGIASRRAAEDFICAGRVAVNGEVATLGQRVGAKDVVTLDGRVVQAGQENIYLMLNKPTGFVTTAKDPQGRPTVLDLVRDVGRRVFPVGRLDLNTEGLLLLTTDGTLAHRLTHPRFGVPKTYVAQVRGALLPENTARLRRGVQLEDGFVRPEDVKVLDQEPACTRVSLTLREGKKREVRRLLAAVGAEVLALKRQSFGPLTLQGLESGRWRHLSASEVELLVQASGEEPIVEP